MAIRLEHHNNVCVVALDGDLRGAEAAGEFRKTVGAALNAGRVGRIVVDFTSARFIDSRGLEALLWSSGRLGDRMGTVRLAGLDANCRKIFEMTRLDDRFESHPDVQAALRVMN